MDKEYIAAKLKDQPTFVLTSIMRHQGETLMGLVAVELFDERFSNERKIAKFAKVANVTAVNNAYQVQRAS